MRNTVLAAALLTVTSLPYGLVRLLSPAVARPVRNYMRPPGALKDEAQFIAACIGCGLCGEVCPPRCILFHKGEGGSAVDTPYILAADKACILCDKCMQACPTEALRMMPKKDIDMGRAVIDRETCYPWIDRGICGACVSICPLGKQAIGYKHWNQYQPVVHDACVGCGLCVEVCPHPSLPIWIVES